MIVRAGFRMPERIRVIILHEFVSDDDWGGMMPWQPDVVAMR